MSSISTGKSSQPDYQGTVYACFAGYIVQAIVNNFAPLLFLRFQKELGIPLSKITMLITFNFGIQLLVDLASTKFVDRIGYRAAVVLADITASVGLIMLTFMPSLTGDPFIGLLISVMVYAIGGGLLEVVISPIVEAAPTRNKEAAMSLLHSFYCWGHVGVVLISTIFFALFGIANWRIMAIVWALFPAVNMISFLKVPIAPLIKEDETGLTISQLFQTKLFWVFMLMMLCAGASEQAVSQWASAFAESGLGISKTLGDLMGPMFFAITMGCSRTLFAKKEGKMDLFRFMVFSALLCMGSYLLISLSPFPILSLLGCGMAGFSVGIFWPGTFSIASPAIRGGGTAMFALFALAGDLGCGGGPTLAGTAASVLGGNLKLGILCAIVFPVLMLAGLVLEKRSMSRAH